MPIAVVLALVLGLAPVGIDQGVSAQAGPVSVDAGDDLHVQAGPAAVHASGEGIAVQAPLIGPVPLAVCLDCAGLSPSEGDEDAAEPAASSGVAAILQDASPAEVAAGTSAAAILVGAAMWIARAAGFLPWFSSFSRIEDDKLADHPTRRQALDFIAANPGATVQDVRHALGIAWGTTVHHLGRLERAGLVAVRRTGGRCGHWPLGQAPARDALPASGRTLAEIVRVSPGLSQADLATRAGMLAPAACKHLARLEAAGLVSAVRDGRTRRYVPTARLDAALGPLASIAVTVRAAPARAWTGMPMPTAIAA